jgi:hypothetical protein
LRIPLSTKTSWALDRLRNRKFWKIPVGRMEDNPDEMWLLWLKIAGLYGLKRPEAPKWNTFKRWIVDQLKSKRRSRLNIVVLTGCILRIEREGYKATTKRIAEYAGISRDTLHRRYVQTGEIKLLRKSAAKLNGNGGEDMKLTDFFSG